MKKFFHKSELDKHYDFFQMFRLSQRKPVVQWAFFSALAIVATFVLAGIFSVGMYRQFSSLKDERFRLNQALESVQGKLGVTLLQSKQYKAMKTKKETLAKDMATKKGLLSLLQTISETIPFHVWLEKISVEGGAVAMKGQALDTQQLDDFYKTLRSTGALRQCRIEKDQKWDSCSFTIRGRCADRPKLQKSIKIGKKS